MDHIYKSNSPDYMNNIVFLTVPLMEHKDVSGCIYVDKDNDMKNNMFPNYYIYKELSTTSRSIDELIKISSKYNI